MDLAVIDAGTLSGVDGFIGTYISDANGAPYAQAVADFFLAGGDLFLLQDTAGYDPIGSLLGVPTFSSSTGSVSNGSAPLFDGPFGTAMDVTQNGSTGELDPDDIAATGGTIAATNADGEVTAAVWNPGDYAPGAGSMVIFGDVDMISGPFGGATYDPLDDNGTFALNAVAFLLEGNEGCFQSGSSVNCVGTDPNGFENTDGGLDVTVQSDRRTDPGHAGAGHVHRDAQRCRRAGVLRPDCSRNGPVPCGRRSRDHGRRRVRSRRRR